MELRSYKTVKKRREALEKEIGQKLPVIGRSIPDEEVAARKNCENMIGAVSLPVGIAGPLLIQPLDGKKRQIYVPLATTEGALVASVNRGAKALAENGPVSVAAELVGATRGPVFEIKSLNEGLAVKKYLLENAGVLEKIAVASSHHLKLIKAETAIAGRRLFIRFAFDTGAAMGMNMVTRATSALAEHLGKTLGIRLISLAGNFDVDKKPAWINVVSGRGYRVHAQAIIKSETIQRVLKTDAKKILEVWQSKCLLGSALSGSMACNCHFANVVAAIFIATGQDPAHVTEAGLGITTIDLENQDLVAGVLLPDLMVGTVGGGTGLAAQQEALGLMGIAHRENGFARRMLAENLAGAVLAGELSLLASLAEGSLVRAHERLGRGKGDL
jgi:hydroxymethylglutaryl-CoA reductase (NADPH)